MSSTSRSPDEKAESAEDPEKPKVASPGRYSLADSEDAVPPTRIDSTTRMPAVRAELASKSSRAVPIPPIPPSIPRPASLAAIGADAKEKKKPPPAPPPRNAGPPASQQGQGTPAKVAPAAPPVKPAEKAAKPSLPEKKADATVGPEAKLEAPKAPADEPMAEAPKPAARLPSVTPPPRTSSLRPPPSSKPASSPPADALLNFEGFDEGSIAFAFDALVSEDSVSSPGNGDFDLAPVRELFSELAANHMRHVRDFMIDVKWGEVTRDWINICVPPVRTLRRGAERLDLVELATALEKLGAELDLANAVGGQLLDANEKQRLLDAYGELVTILPQAFALDRDKTQREAVIVQALLLQVPDVRKVTIDKLHAAGLTSLTLLFDANADDLAHVAGIPHALAARIVERVQAYRAELQASSPQDARAAEREKLAALNGQLKEHHDAYEAAANGWTPEAKAKKRDQFRAREETWLEISVLLARFGEVDRLQGIEKVPFAQRIAQLTEYLEEARDKYRSAET